MAGMSLTELLQSGAALLLPTLAFGWKLSEDLLSRIKKLEGEHNDLWHKHQMAEAERKYADATIETELQSVRSDVDKLYRHSDRNRRAIADITNWISRKGFTPRSNNWPTSDPPTMGQTGTREPITDIPRD